MHQSYPDTSPAPQDVISPWWQEVGSDAPIRPGSLGWAYPPFTEQRPFMLELVARSEPTEHRVLKYTLKPLVPGAHKLAPTLPIAAFPDYPEEVKLVLRSKNRPVLVLSLNGHDVDPAFSRPRAAWQVAPSMLVAPYFGIEKKDGRAGWDPRFVERIRRCGFPQYMWDHLPISSSTSSILRLDHAQGLPMQPSAFKHTGFQLSEDALRLVREWYLWLLLGHVPKGGVLELIRELLFTEDEIAAPPGSDSATAQPS